MCNEVFSLNSTKSSEDEDINLNKAAVSGIMGIGGGFYNLEEFLATVEIPFMTAKTYQKHNKIVADRWKQTSCGSSYAASD
jgi:hypothetical protein